MSSFIYCDMKKKKKYVHKKIKKRFIESYSDGKRQLLLANNVTKEAFFRDSLMTVVGRSEVWIENYKLLLLYEEDKIQVQTQNDIICIEGNGLFIRHYMEEHMMICGRITKITYC